ncbi:unnamed protein product [Caenorhabditis nigoni]
MTQPLLKYQSKTATFTGTASKLDISDENGIKCTWSAYVRFGAEHLNWKFDWGELYNQGVDRLTGYIKIKERNNFFPPQKIHVDLKETVHTVSKAISDSEQQLVISFKYSLTPHHAPPETDFYDILFAPSHMNDTVLVIEGKKIHVSKAFLSYHSEYFEALFSKNFKEGSLSEIEIKEVSYDDFGLLCSSFYPYPQFPNDRTVEKLLELGRRFLLRTVIRIVEHHLLHISKIVAQKMIWLADEYGMEVLMEKCIHELDSLEKAKQLKTLPEFEKLTDKTKVLILGRIMEFM